MAAAFAFGRSRRESHRGPSRPSSINPCPGGEPVPLCPGLFTAPRALQRGRGCNSSPASSGSAGEKGFQAHIWPAVLPAAPIPAGGSCWARGGLGAPPQDPPHLPNLPGVLGLINRLQRGKEFSTCHSGRNHGDFCLPPYHGVENIWAYQLPVTAGDVSTSNAWGCSDTALGALHSPWPDSGALRSPWPDFGALHSPWPEFGALHPPHTHKAGDAPSTAPAQVPGASQHWKVGKIILRNNNNSLGLSLD